MFFIASTLMMLIGLIRVEIYIIAMLVSYVIVKVLHGPPAVHRLN